MSQHGSLPCFLMCSEHHPHSGPIFLLCLLTGYLAYLIVRMAGHTLVTSSQALLRIIELASVSHSKFIFSQGHSLPVSFTLAQAEGQRGSRALEGLLLAKNLPDLRVAHGLAVGKVTVAVSEVSRDTRQAQARCWRMAVTCPPLSLASPALPRAFPCCWPWCILCVLKKVAPEAQTSGVHPSCIPSDLVPRGCSSCQCWGCL